MHDKHWFETTANLDELISIIHKLGTQTVRSKRLIQLSKVYLQEPPSMYDLRKSRTCSSPQRKSRFFISSSVAYPSTPVSHLPGAGTYALDSYRIFCSAHDDPTSEEWKLVQPTDKELIRYLVGPKYQ
jgi:methyl-CpG-binding domain protein 4